MNTTVSLPEASKLASVSQTSIRRWIKLEKVEATQDKQGKWLIDRQSLLAKLATTPPQLVGATVANEVGRSENRTASAQLLEATMEALRREQRISDDLRSEISKLASENRQLHAEIRALLDPKTKSKLGEFVSRWVRI